MIIDSHVHFVEKRGFAGRLARKCDRLGIGKVFLLGGDYDKGAIRGGIRRALKDHPDLFLGFGMFKLGRDHADAVDAFYEAGFTGLKCIRPLSDYDDKAYYPIYERAERLGMLNLIGAHFGNPWSDEAAMAARWNPNLFFDLSGSILKYRSPEYFRQLLWWGKDPTYLAPDGTGPWDKILFGSDVDIPAMAGVMDDYRRLMDALHLSEKDRNKVWGGNARRLLNDLGVKSRYRPLRGG